MGATKPVLSSPFNYFTFYDLNRHFAAIVNRHPPITQTDLDTTLKDMLLRCELNFIDVAAVLVIAVSSVFSAATAVKTDITTAKVDVTTVKTATTSVNTVMILNFQTHVTTFLLLLRQLLLADVSFYCYRISISAVTTVFTAASAENTDEAAVSNTSATSVKFSSHRSKMSFSVNSE